MPTNQQRRDAAKRKLERQLVRRQERVKVRRQRTIIASIVAGVLLVGGAIWLITSNKSSADTSSSAAGSSSSGTETSESAPTTPCSYPATGQAAAREVQPPSNLNPAKTGTVDVTINLGQGAVQATLDRELAPCAVNAFLSLASQGFYDNSPCHRLTDQTSFHILQCGDPSGTGRGGPGFEFANESAEIKQSDIGTQTSAASTDSATTHSAATDPAATDPASSDPSATDTASTDTASTDTGATDTAATTTTPAHYPVGTIAMASTAPNGKNGSQFFIVYDETTIDSTGYTKIGTVGDAGLTVVRDIAAKGTIADDQGVADKPAEAVTITNVVVPAEAVSAEAPPSSAVESTDAEPFPTDTVATEATPTDTAAPGTGGTDSTDAGATEPSATDTSPPTG